MAKRTKVKEVAKFGGTEDMGRLKEVKNTFHSGMTGKTHQEGSVDYDLKSLEVQSKTKLEEDTGHGNAAIIRCFTFGMNLEIFRLYQPTRQELFNSHYKGIEVALWKDGMKVLPEVNPRIVVDEQKMQYQIFVGAAPMKGHLLSQRPNTLRELANDDVSHG